MNKCDVIIPIYNAYDDVIECIESVLKNTKFDSNKLILINDNSTDERIEPMLKQYSKKYKNIILFLSNSENLGFVGTVNKGMKLSKNDVVLLNSDTEVTKKWLDKMIACAYSSENIATVTPLSNNATLASVPKTLVPNDLPDGYTLEQMSEIVEECSLNYYPEIPTGHGFCLYIKREAINKVGFFDEESFGKGYGEENDFCFRCYEYGYRHVLCDNTYIYHKESKSFLDSKAELIESGLKVLQKKYPNYKHQLDIWINNKPVEFIGNNISLALGNKLNKPNILFLIHDWKNIKKNLGGTTLHAWDLIKNMRDKFNFHVFAPEDGIFKVYSYFENSDMEIKFPIVTANMTKFNYYNGEYKRLLDSIVKKYKISFVHVHHTIGHYFDLVDVFKENEIPYMVTLHDFFSICPVINKLYKGEVYCGIENSSQKCNECLNCVYKTKIDIDSWRKEWDRLLKNAYKIITPSDATKEEIKDVYSSYDITTIEHGIDIIKNKSELNIESKNRDIAFIGAIGFHKGSSILEQFVKKDRLNNSKVHLFGITNFQDNKSNRHFINHGRYVRDELKDLLQKNNIKLICLFSTWPETYSYTMTEAIACGIPVISFDFGAIAERIKKYNLGWVIPLTNDIEIITKKINEILSNSEGYEKVIKSINKYKIITSSEMASNYIKIYSKCAKDKGSILEAIKELMINNRVVLTGCSYPDYSWVFGTLKWRIINKIKIPRKIKKIYRSIRRKKGSLKGRLKHEKN